MSLNTSSILKPRAVIENYDADFKTTLHSMDLDKIFERVIKLDVQKEILKNALFSPKPVHLIFIGPAGTGKSLLLKCVYDAFQSISHWSDAQTSSGIGVIESILLKGKMLRFLIVDELEKLDRDDLDVFLGLMAHGSINRELAKRTIKETGFNVWFFATSNNLRSLQRRSAPLVNRCSIVEVPALAYNDYLFVSGKRLLQEQGIETEELGRYIASRVYHDFGTTDMRLAVRLANFSMGYIRRKKQEEITKDIIDKVAGDFKRVIFRI